MKYITRQGNVFLLRTAHTALLLQITGYGHVELLHYGRFIPLEDAPAMAARRTMPYGSQVMYTEEDRVYCLDNIPLLWSGVGKGDFRTPPIELELPDGTLTTDFIYEDCGMRPGTLPVLGLPAAYDETGEAETLVLKLREAKFSLRLELVFTVFPETDVIVRHTALYNDETAPIIIRRLMSQQIDLPQREYNMLTLDGDWISETHTHIRSVQPGVLINESTTGSSSNRHNPGVILMEEGTGENAGLAYGFNLLYSGSHCTAVERSSRDFVRVVSGIQPRGFCWRLPSGEIFRTPEAVMTVSNEGLNGVSGNFHRFVRQHILRGDWKEKPRPVLINNWEAHFFDFTEAKLLTLAKQAKAAGTELFVLDDGWFGERNSDTAGLGDYTVNRKKLPQGIEGLAEKLNGLGLRFGLWFEPESVNPDSDLYRAHPEWALQQPGRQPSMGRHQLLLDLTRPEVRDYIVHHITHLLDHCPISYVKWDMNRHMSDLYSAVTPGGELPHRYILGLYEVLERIFTPRPHVLLESCSSGGNRFDLGMLCYSPQIWASDDTDPMERLAIQQGLSLFYPPCTIGAHVSQSTHQQTLRQTPLSTRFNVAAFGALGYELDLGELSPEEKKQVAAQIEWYKKYRATLQYGDFFRIPTHREELYSWAVLSPDRKQAVVLLAQRLCKAAPPADYLTVPQLLPEARYRVTAVPQQVAVARFGGLVKHIAPVRLSADGLVMRTVNRHYSLPDGSFSAEASGAALAVGIPLNDQFLGTGYHGELRLWGDFGSQLYLVEMLGDHEEDNANEQT